jgi:hypothetical protein
MIVYNQTLYVFTGLAVYLDIIVSFIIGYYFGKLKFGIYFVIGWFISGAILYGAISTIFQINL